MKRFNFPEGVPLHYTDDDRNIRVPGSRVTLYTLVASYQVGDSIEDIHEGFPSVTLEQIEAVIGWYLENQAEVDEHIREVEAEAEKLWLEIESRPESIAFREKLRGLREQRIKT